MVEEMKSDEQLSDKIKMGKIVLSTNTKIGQGLTAKQKMLVCPAAYTIDNAAYSIEMDMGVADLKTTNTLKIKKNQNWPEKQLLIIVKSIADYIQFLAKDLGIYHTEIMMQNVLITKDTVSGEFEVKLIDFANAIIDVAQHPKLTKSSQENFCDKQKEFQFMKIQCEGIELQHLCKMIKVMLHTSIFQFHKDQLIKNMKVDTPDYWKLISEHSRSISEFLQKWSDEYFRDFSEQKLEEIYSDIKKLY